jgi:hypothetical protein
MDTRNQKELKEGQGADRRCISSFMDWASSTPACMNIYAHSAIYW